MIRSYLQVDKNELLVAHSGYLYRKLIAMLKCPLWKTAPLNALGAGSELGHFVNEDPHSATVLCKLAA